MVKDNAWRTSLWLRDSKESREDSRTEQRITAKMYFGKGTQDMIPSQLSSSFSSKWRCFGGFRVRTAWNILLTIFTYPWVFAMVCVRVCACVYVHTHTYTQSRDNFCGVSSLLPLFMGVLGLKLSLAGLSSNRGLYPPSHLVSRKWEAFGE